MGAEKLPILGKSGFPIVGRLLKRLEAGVFWYENPGWERHVLSPESNRYDVGNTLGDITGNGREDLLVGQGVGAHGLYWFEQPEDPRDEWPRYLIDSAFEKYHDLAFGDVDNDGEPELVGTSQRSEVVFYYDVPGDPYQSPWPAEYRHIIAENTDVEGLAVVDLDGDGRQELIAGTSVYRLVDQSIGHGSPGAMRANGNGGGNGGVSADWRREDLITGWDWTRVAVGDIDGDGDLEVVFAEGDSPYLDGNPGRVAWCDPPEWEVHLLRDDLYCPHSVDLADFNGNGRLDIYVAEMGLGEHDDDARHFVFCNRGNGRFEETIIERGVPTHEARAVDVNGDGRVDIIGKSYEPNVHVDVWYNETPH